MSIFIIGEIGINHNGDLKVCKEMIDLAADSGCDAVKFQKRTIDNVYTADYLKEKRESPWGTTQREQKEGLEFGLEEFKEIDSYCKEKGIEWFASAWDLDSVEFLKQFNPKHNKIASAMIVWEDLLKAVAEQKIHTFISTGGSTLEDIDRAVKIFKDAGCPYELMHCKSTYPMQDEDANLKCIETLRERYKCDVGYSGHEAGLAVSYAAAALGVTSLERHVTLSRAMYGSDQSASIEPSGLRMLVGVVRKIQSVMGNGKIDVLDDEVPIMKKLRQHIPDRVAS